MFTLFNFDIAVVAEVQKQFQGTYPDVQLNKMTISRF
jgi:hypothetical protein